jgi:hypothetical protein
MNRRSSRRAGPGTDRCRPRPRWQTADLEATYCHHPLNPYYVLWS